jgi:hypothetical protein
LQEIRTVNYSQIYPPINVVLIEKACFILSS